MDNADTELDWHGFISFFTTRHCFLAVLNYAATLFKNFTIDFTYFIVRAKSWHKFSYNSKLVNCCTQRREYIGKTSVKHLLVRSKIKETVSQDVVVDYTDTGQGICVVLDCADTR